MWHRCSGIIADTITALALVGISGLFWYYAIKTTIGAWRFVNAQLAR